MAGAGGRFLWRCEAHRVDEVKPIRDKAVAVRTYAMQRKDRGMMDDAIDIWKRAEIRGGELLREMAEKGERSGPHGTGRTVRPVLSDLGVTKTQSSRWQAFAALPVELQEAKSSINFRRPALRALIATSRFMAGGLALRASAGCLQAATI